MPVVPVLMTKNALSWGQHWIQSKTLSGDGGDTNGLELVVGVTTNKYGVSHWDDNHSLKLDCGDGYTTVGLYEKKNTELYSLKGYILWCVN